MAIYLLAPLVEPVRIPSRYAEQVQRAHRDLNQQNTAPLDVGKEHLNNAVGKGQQKEGELQANLHRDVGIKARLRICPAKAPMVLLCSPAKIPARSAVKIPCK